MTARAQARLDARLSPHRIEPVVLALSGGGDSMALLALVGDWAKSRGRRLVAVTVDHGLNPDSADWSHRCAVAAGACGVDWIGEVWTGDKPSTGLTAAARRARHILIARAAYRVGARAILTGHTADDVAEGDWMRARPVDQGGANMGRLREWSPSPVWPEGRGLMLMRPLLGERRESLRDLLRSRGLDWIDDPANLDPRFGRSRARRALDGAAPVEPEAAEPRLRLPPLRSLPFGAGFETGPDLPMSALAALLVSASGGDVPPRGERLGRLSRRLATGEDFAAALSGARIEARGDRMIVGREAGEIRRRGSNPIALAPHSPTVWDGRIEVTVSEPGWRIAAAQGMLSRLSQADRRALSILPPWARGAAPVLIRDGTNDALLAGRAGQVRFLSPRRLNLALSGFGFTFAGETTQEDGLFDGVHGETPTTDLFSV